ncbi:heme biosynthesis protein HemY [Pseudochelatococcus contaminans]|uniref:HemY protein n=1 Tax=Pseudochelatococcus contaminans TaxID=1538103 RepID=A0A7W6EFG4_9HYPH|nr:heme biosynthesis HemY N-terminal domain-containing protein [Pseudochelatococcus contaminans]MBB3808818.1 HemY protein [Pseudochelatococcus contaminans]
MLRIVGFIIALGLIALGISWLADRPGDVSVVWQGYRIETSVVVALAAVGAIAVAVVVLWGLFRYVFGLPGAISLSSRARRRAKGFTSVSRGLIAVGTGDSPGARRHATEAERLLGREPLTLLLKAQAAQMSGDRAGAETAFTEMLETSETRVLGLRGLFVEARRKGDDAAARAYALRASELAPKVTWASEAVLEYQSADQDWRGALATLERQSRQKAIGRDTAKRLRAVLLTANALSHQNSDPQEATREAREAVKLAPDLVPAAVLAGRLLSREGNLRKAARILEAAWKLSPHPDIASAYLDLRPGDSARDRLERAQTLARIAPNNPESRLLKAAAALEVRDFDRARQAIAPLLDDHPTVRTCLLMADIAEAEHGTAGEWREWIGRASRAPRDPAWIADGMVSETWLPVSPVSGRLDAFRWSAPVEQIGDDTQLPQEETESATDNERDATVLAAPAAAIAGVATVASTHEPSEVVTPVVEEPAAVFTETIETPVEAVPQTALPEAPAPQPPLPAEPLPEDIVPPAGSTAVAAIVDTPVQVNVAEQQEDGQTVVFPLAHAPDDPGPDAPDALADEPVAIHRPGVKP